jgi:hypothetical protein
MLLASVRLRLLIHIIAVPKQATVLAVALLLAAPVDAAPLVSPGAMLFYRSSSEHRLGFGGEVSVWTNPRRPVAFAGVVGGSDRTAFLEAQGALMVLLPVVLGVNGGGVLDHRSSRLGVQGTLWFGVVGAHAMVPPIPVIPFLRVERFADARTTWSVGGMIKVPWSIFLE